MTREEQRRLKEIDMETPPRQLDLRWCDSATGGTGPTRHRQVP